MQVYSMVYGMRTRLSLGIRPQEKNNLVDLNDYQVPGAEKRWKRPRSVHPLSFSTRLIVEVYEAIDVLIFMYAKPHGSIFVCFSVKLKCTFRPLQVVYVVNIYK